MRLVNTRQASDRATFSQAIQVVLPQALAEVRDKPVLSRTLPADVQALRAELEA